MLDLLLKLVIVFLLALSSCSWFVSAAMGNEFTIIAGTTHIEDITSDLLKKRVNVSSIIPGGACPGHYDLSPADLKAANTAKGILLQPWQLKLHNIRRMLDAVELNSNGIRSVDVAGSWMHPKHQKEATRVLMRILSELIPQSKELIARRGAARIARVSLLSSTLKSRLESNMSSVIPVLANEMQRDFLKWSGCSVVAHYGTIDQLSPREMGNLIAKARQSSVKLVVDNLQSGGGIADQMAKELGVPYVTLSNFPGASDRGETWDETFTDNVERLLLALKEGDNSE